MEVKPAAAPKPIVVEDRTSSDVKELLNDYKQPVTPTPNVSIPDNSTSSPNPGTVNTLGNAGLPTTNPVQQPNGTTGAPLPGQQVEYYKSGKKAGQPKPPRKVRVGFTPAIEMSQINSNLLSGALFLTIVDLILPLLFAALNNKFSKVKVKASELMMSAKQKNELAPIADKVMAQVNIHANPTALLFVSMFAIYGMNLAALQLTKNILPDEKNHSNNPQKQSGQTNSFDPAQYVSRKAA